VIFSCVTAALVPDFAELFNNMQEQNMQEFISHSEASEFVTHCMRVLAAANPAREQQGPAAHIRAGG
jgi:hypothetical protein